MSLVSNYDYLIKVIIIGDTCIYPIKIDVGKSNILTQYIQNKFKIDHEITIGVEFLAKNIQINNKLLRLQVWDTVKYLLIKAGQESFRSITRSYYKNSACAIIVYDITNRGSFKKIENWLKECIEMSPKSIVLVLVGNKIDLSEMSFLLTI
jgi:small GTP-binding protein